MSPKDSNLGTFPSTLLCNIPPQTMQRSFKSAGFTTPVLFGEPAFLPMLFLLVFVWLLPHTPYPDRIRAQIQVQYESLPSVYIDWHPNKTFEHRFESNKTALYIETRSDKYFTTPLLLHMMEVVPPDWRFLFLGSDETTQIVRASLNTQEHLRAGRLVARSIENSKWVQGWGRRWEDIGLNETHNRLLTNASFYEEELGASSGTEHLLVFRSESILCTNAESDLNEWLQYDWVGAPWSMDDRFSGNGGLSIRKLSKVLEVLGFQQRLNNENAEDRWLSARLAILPGANVATPSAAVKFSVNTEPFDKPLGYQVEPRQMNEQVWGTLEKRKKIFEWCPEVKMILDMELSRERCQ